MKTISEQYMNEMHDEYKYFATWEPGTPLTIGDIGELSHNQFTRLSNLATNGFQFDFLKDRSKSALNYTSSSEIKITAKLTGNVGIPRFNLSLADAGMTVEFGSKKGIVFEAEGVEHQMIDKVDKLDQWIKQEYNQKKWPENWVVISDLIVADSGTVLISRGKNAAISLKAKTNVPNLSLANIDANFGIAYQSGMNTKIVCQAGLTPLFKIRGISKTVIGGTIIGPKAEVDVGESTTRNGNYRLPASKPVELVAVKEIDFEPF